MKSLQEIWDEMPQKSDKGDVHSYLPVYEQILAPYRETAHRVLEIGLFNGHSLRMWEEYFTHATVYGIDCDEQPHGGLADLRPMMAEGTHVIYIMDAGNLSDVNKTFRGIKFDIIIEDAGHDIESQIWLFNIYKNFLAEGGIYVIEDVQDVDKTGDQILANVHMSNMNGEILDRRHIKGRYDDCLVIIKDKQ